jgi:hypothetical protein
MQQIDERRSYLEGRLNWLRDQELIMDYVFTKSEKSGYFKVYINSRGFDAELYTDLQNTMEITISGYYRDVTDYLISDFDDTVKWYLEIIRNIATKKYTVIEYRRTGKVVCRYLKMAVRGKNILIGDFRNHLKLFTKKVESVGRDL